MGASHVDVVTSKQCCAYHIVKHKWIDALNFILYKRRHFHCRIVFHEW